MSFDGSHYVCSKHKKEKHYSSADERWFCSDCEIEGKYGK